MGLETSDREGYAPFDLYPYNPEQAPAFAFLGLFGVVAIAHLAAMIPFRSIFPLPLVIGCGMEAVAYYFRSRSHDNVRQTLPFVIQNLLLLSAAPFLAASIFMSPRRIARVLNSEHLLVNPRTLTKLFILVDITCFATQVAGSIMSASEDANEATQGKTTILAGLILQVVALGTFATWTFVFQVRMRKNASSSKAFFDKLGWQRHVHGLYSVSLLFAIRNITRVIEYNQGPDGEMLSNEVYLYVLDGGFMLAVAVIFLILHPGRLRQKARRLAKAGSLEHVPLE